MADLSQECLHCSGFHTTSEHPVPPAIDRSPTAVLAQEHWDYVAWLEAAVDKSHAERKAMHEMLTKAGIPEACDLRHPDERSCLLGRLNVALGRLR